MSEPTYIGTISRFRSEYDQLDGSGRSVLFIVPHGVLSLFVLIIYLMIPQRPSILVRTAVFLLIVILSLSSIRTDRSITLCYGVLVGISDFCCIILSVNFLCLHDPARDFRRRTTSVTKPGSTVDKVQTPPDEWNWDGIPKPLFKRLFWAYDLVASIRALHWSYGPSLSQHYYQPTIHKQVSFGHNVLKLLLIYLGVDCLKEIIALDPYFWGYIDHSPPGYILKISESLTLIQAYRMLVCFAVIFLAVQFLSTIGFLLFVNVLGPSVVGPWGHSWAHSPPFGDFISISRRGLQSWWGSWWHQWFRNMAISPANALIIHLQVPQNGAIARSIRIVIAFGITGAIHACGSCTLWGSSRPMDSFVFFALQPVGIAFQRMGSWVLDRFGILRSIPIQVRQAINVIFALWWLLKTFPLMADDYARGGLWLTEPFPVSVLQMLGLGSAARSHIPLMGDTNLERLSMKRNIAL